MKIEIIKGDNNPVADFFSSPSNTPETDAAWSCFKGHTELLHDVQNLSRKLERERDEAKEHLSAAKHFLNKYITERDEAREELLEQARLLGMSSEREAKLISERDEARKKYDNLATEHMLVVNKLCNERDEAKSISDELAIIASLCLGWHDHESNDTAIKIAAALKRWKKSKVSNEQD